MIPILFPKNETNFSTNGLGRLPDCISCVVREERNGIYECEFQYPVNGQNYAKIQIGRIVSVTHDETRTRQPFAIYRITTPINGVCTVNAHHVSYDLTNVIMPPFHATSVADAFDQMERNAITRNGFTFWTDKVGTGNFTQDVPAAIRSILVGQQGSILDAFGGGDYEFDHRLVRLYQDRGSDQGVTIRYGKNLTDLTQEIDVLNTYNAVVPYWLGGDGELVMGGIVVGSGAASGTGVLTNHNLIPLTDHNGNNLTAVEFATVAVPLDLSQEFDEKPTRAQLQNKAQTKLENNQPWITKQNIKVDFVALWQTEEYKNVANLERVRMCDTVSVIYPDLGVNIKKKVIKVEYNVLLDRYNYIELGDKTTTFADVIEKNTADVAAQTVEEAKSDMQLAIDHVTDLITGGLGGHVVMKTDAEGKPQEILIMDTENMETAVQVLRININGIGFSSNGIDGPFRTGWTLDGQFVADFITAGTLSANRIKGGTLTLGGANNGNGTLRVLDASGKQIGLWDNTGASITGDLTLMARDGASVVYQGGIKQTTYWDWGLVEGHLVEEEGYGFAVERKDGGVLKSQIALIQTDKHIVETYIAPYGWHKCIVSGTPTRGEATYINASSEGLWMHGHTFMPGSTERGFYLYVGGYITTGKQSNFRITDDMIRVHTQDSDTQTISDDYTQLDISSDEINLHGAGADVKLLVSNRISIIASDAQNAFSVNGGKGYVNGTQLAFVSSSSERYKHNISDIKDKGLDPHRLYDLQPKQFVYNDDAKLQYKDTAGKTIPGFIAEEVEKVYPAAVIHDEDGCVESWDERRIIPGMLALIQEQKKQIDDLEKRIERLEEALCKFTS